MKYDDVLERLGQFGSFQKRIYLLLCLPSITTSIQTFLSVFIMATPEHRCAVPGLQNDTYAVQDTHHADLINATVRGACYILTSANVSDNDVAGYDVAPFNVSAARMQVKGEGEWTINGSLATSLSTCSRYVYDRSMYEETIITEMNLVCSKDGSRTTAQMVMMMGSFTGTFLFQSPADVLGRKKMLMVGLVLHMVVSLAMAWATCFPVVCFCMFVNGASAASIFANCFVIGMEMVGAKKRVWAGYVMEIFWSLGMILLAPLAFFLRDWQHLQITTSILPFAFLSYFWLIPESPRWLLTKGRVTEAEAILQRAARVNKVTLPTTALHSSSVPGGDSTGQSLLTVCRHPVLICRCSVIFYTWFVSSLAFYGLGLNVGSLGGSVYVNFLLSGLMEVVAHVLCICLLDRVGRRVLNSSLMLLAGVACTATILTTLYAPASLQWTTIALAMIGKFGIAGSFATIWVYSSELFPTFIRNSSMGISSAFARVGSVVSPYIANLVQQQDLRDLLARTPFS